ncbi:hypothetical protein ABPG75_009418 [Micractinium tetrahymenae]
MNEAQWEFAFNWRHHVQKVGIDYYVVAATDAPTSRRLAEMGEACFEQMDEETQKLGLAWGQEGWRRMTWSKVFLVDSVVDFGFNLVISDVDAVWFRDPLPLFAEHAAAGKEQHLLFSHDGTSSRNPPGDGGLEVGASPYYSFNTGIYLLRNNAATREWAHAYRAFYDKCPNGHDQSCAYEMMRTQVGEPHPATPPGKQPRVSSAWHNKVWMGILPASVAMSAHTAFLQRLAKVKKVQPYVVHMTWTYNGIPGKRSRLRDMGLWVDPPQYYSNGSFVTVDLQLPESPSDFNRWNENEDLISFHLDTIHHQLQQAYVGMALAVASGRGFILPKFMCWCEKIWYSVVRCRTAEAQDMPLPVACPQDYLFQPGNYDDAPEQHGTPLSIREAGFLQNKHTPAEVKARDSVLTIQPSAELTCCDCVKEQPAGAPSGGPLLLIPPELTDAQLLPLLAPYTQKYRVWRLSFEGVGGARRAFRGFADPAAAQAFNRRMEHMTTNFCCRRAGRAEESPRYHKDGQNSVQLSMMSQFRYEGGGQTREADPGVALW